MHRSGDWRAWSLGLLAQLDDELRDECPALLALVGDIGSGKTMALDAYRDKVVERSPKEKILWIDVGMRSPEQWPSIHRDIYLEVLAALGEEIHDAVVKKLGISQRSGEKYLQQHQIFGIIQEMVQRSWDGGVGVHVLIDECQRPMEHYENLGDTNMLSSWFEQLKNLAEVISRGHGHLLITTTTSPWDAGPQKVRDRFVPLRADAPSSDEIQAFINEGLTHTAGDKPDRASAGLGAAIREAHDALITPRDLHDLLWRLWNKAHRSSATELTADHLR